MSDIISTTTNQNSLSTSNVSIDRITRKPRFWLLYKHMYQGSHMGVVLNLVPMFKSPPCTTIINTKTHG